jgi:hypothetical protein
MDSTDRILYALGEIKGELGELRAEGRGRDTQLADLKTLIAAHVEADNKVANRVSQLEHDKSRMKGIVIALSALGGIAASVGVAVAKAVL